MSGFLTLEEAAERLGVEYKTVYRLVRSGDIPAGKVGRIYRIRDEDLEGYFERQKRLLAQETSRSGLTALEGRRCAACDGQILSELSVAGKCEKCDGDICQACWAIRKVRRCAAHTDDRDGTEVTESATEPTVEKEGKKKRISTVTTETGLAETIKRLREEGTPVVTSAEAKLAEEGFIRAFAQRFETVEELPDPLSKHVVLLRKARVKHILTPAERSARDLPANLVSRFTLRSGGWGKPKSGLVLEARFVSRPEILIRNGYDTEPLGEMELALLLKELRARAKKEQCFHVALLGSPTGWDAAAQKIVTQPRSGRAFQDRLVGVALYDLQADDAHVCADDKRLMEFWPLLAPGRFARELTRCVDLVRELAGKLDGVALDYAAGSLGLPGGWVRAAFGVLEQTGRFVRSELPELGLVLSRRSG